MIIGITGDMGVGKTTAANIVADITNGVIVPFAKPLKDYARSLGWDGQKDSIGRKLLQLLGTECGRNCICQNIWVDKWLNEIAETMDNAVKGDSPIIICDDLRFNNEAKAVKAKYGYIIRITGRRRGLVTTRLGKWYLNFKRWCGLIHKSEQGINNCYVDFVIDNRRNKTWLEEELKRILEAIKD